MKIERTESGLKCDNPKCDWNDMTITDEQMPDYINASCPKCGENILTQQDYSDYQKVLKVLEIFGGLSQDEIDNLYENLGFGATEYNEEKMYKMTLNVHNGINLSDIKEEE